MFITLTNPTRIIENTVTIQYLCYLAGSLLFVLGSTIGLILNLKG